MAIFFFFFFSPRVLLRASTAKDFAFCLLPFPEFLRFFTDFSLTVTRCFPDFSFFRGFCGSVFFSSPRLSFSSRNSRASPKLSCSFCLSSIFLSPPFQPVCTFPPRSPFHSCSVPWLCHSKKPTPPRGTTGTLSFCCLVGLLSRLFLLMLYPRAFSFKKGHSVFMSPFLLARTPFLP